MDYLQQVYEEIATLDKNGVLTVDALEKYPPDLLFFVQKKFWKYQNMKIVKMIAELARKRMADKGFVRCGEFGWFKREDVQKAGLCMKHNRWIYEDDYTNGHDGAKGVPMFSDICRSGKLTTIWKKYKEESKKEAEARRDAVQASLS